MLGGSIVSLAIFIVVVAAVIGIVLVAVRASGIAVPPWVTTVLWIVFGAVICIVAIKVVAGFAGAVIVGIPGA